MDSLVWKPSLSRQLFAELPLTRQSATAPNRQIVRLTRVLKANTYTTAIFFDKLNSRIFKSNMY